MRTESETGTETTTDHATAPESGRRDVDWEQAREATRLLLDAVGEDPDREGLRDTWQRRVPEAFAELTEGNDDAAKPTMRTFPAENEELVVKTGIPLYSLSLQNEPSLELFYNTCIYSGEQFRDMLKVVGPIIRQAHPDLLEEGTLEEGEMELEAEGMTPGGE